MSRLVVALLVGVMASSCASPITASAGTSPSATAADPGPVAGERQQHEAGAVTITASWTAGTSSALIEMDTHSVDLDGFDLKELARVRLDSGPWIDPTAWDAPKGGHHRAGRLSFGSLEPEAFASARAIELEIRDVSVPTRLLRWERAR